MPRTEAASPLLLYMLKQVELAVRARIDEIVRPVGLTAAQYTALTVLERHTDMSSAQLARNSFVTAQSMADMITALEGRKLIERHRDKSDRRRLVVALTDEGRALLDRCRDDVDALEATMPPATRTCPRWAPPRRASAPTRLPAVARPCAFRRSTPPFWMLGLEIPAT
jgi:DNA-binding MarR family transcriptional regulator